MLGTIVSSAILHNTGLEAYTLEPKASFISSIPGSPLFGDGYGATVSFNGDWTFVSAPIAHPDNKAVAGAIYVYKKGHNGYEETQIITTNGTSDHLGGIQIFSRDDWLLFSLIGTPKGPIQDGSLENQNFQGSIRIYHLEDEQKNLTVHQFI